MSLPPILPRPSDPCDRRSDVHRLNPQAGDRPVYRGDRRQLSCAECASARLLDEWLNEINEALAAWDRDHPDRPAAPFAVNQIVHRSNDRFEQDMAICAKWKVPIVITSLGARVELNEAVHAWAGSPFTTSSTTASRARRSRKAPTASSRLPPAPAATPGAGRRSRCSRKSASGSTAR